VGRLRTVFNCPAICVSGDEGRDFPGLVKGKNVLALVGFQEAVADKPSGPAHDGAERAHKVSRETSE
jgi:hypothetical protein